MLKEHEEQPLSDYAAADNMTAQKAHQSENGKEMLKEHEERADSEPLHENGAAKIMENESDEEMLKEHEEVTNAEALNDNGAAKIAEKGTTSGKESHEDYDDQLRYAIETMVPEGLSDYQKKLRLSKLMSLGTAEKRKLCDEGKALLAEERRLMIKKLKFETMVLELFTDPRSW